MPFIFETEHIDKNAYEKVLRRYISIQFGREVWHEILRDWEIYVIDVLDSDKYRKMYALTKWNTSISIPWGFTQPPTTHQPGRIFWFVNDRANPFIIRQNAEKGCHEAAHAGTYIKLGTERRARKFDDPGARAGTMGPAYVTLVHDVAYGYKNLLTFWIRWKFMWLPLRGLNMSQYL